MLTLVKTLKTLGLSDRMDWTIAKKRVVGVTSLDGTTMGMSFQVPGYGVTRCYSKNHSMAVVFMTHHTHPSPVDDMREDVEQELLDRVLDSSGVNSGNSKCITTIETFHNYFVFKMGHNENINKFVLQYRLQSMGVKTIMDFNIHEALVVKLAGITWHFFDSNRVLAIVGGHDLKESVRIVKDSWKKMIIE